MIHGLRHICIDMSKAWVAQETLTIFMVNARYFNKASFIVNIDFFGLIRVGTGVDMTDSE